MAHHGACPGRQVCGAVGGIIIIYINHRFREHPFEIGHHLFDGKGFIPAGNQYGNPVHHFISIRSDTLLFYSICRENPIAGRRAKGRQTEKGP